MNWFDRIINKKYRNENATRDLFFVLGLSFVFVIGLWAVDIGASGAIMEAHTGIPLVAQSLFLVRTPVQQYHLGLILASLVWLIAMLMLVHFILEVNYGRGN